MPLAGGASLSDLPIALGLPVILVVGVRLGCINHAVLSAEAILRDDLPLAGWVANLVDPATSRLEENLATLAERLPAPCLGRIPAWRPRRPRPLRPAWTWPLWRYKQNGVHSLLFVRF